MNRYIPIAALCLMFTPAYAAEVGEVQAESIDLGGFRGVVFYTAENEGYRVVVTIAQGETGLPVRFEAMLTETQKMTITVPGKLGEKSHVLEMSRAGDKLLVAHPQDSVGAVVLATPEISTP
jgi:hypothetical protein